MVLEILLHQLDIVIEVAVSIFVLVDEAQLPASGLRHLLVHQDHDLFISVRDADPLGLKRLRTEIFLDLLLV